MGTHADRLRLLERMMREAAREGFGFHTADDLQLDGRTLEISGRRVIHFASCSYLGLEIDPRLKEGAINAVERYGTQFSSSRAYVSAPPYRALEDRLAQIFGGHAIATPTTTLAHLSALPILVEEDDVLLLDHQVHQSVQLACQQVRSIASAIEMVRHSRIDLLEERVLEHSRHGRRVWYLCDGIYSMYGDHAPLERVAALLHRYENFRLYVDDAHGMSWTGERGSGFALGRIPLQPRMILATSLNKAFGAGGGALVFEDEKEAERVRQCAGPLTFAGPIQPAQLGAAIASADIHLSDEIRLLQDRLADRIHACARLLRDRSLPLISDHVSPIRFIGIGQPKVAKNVVARLARSGLFTNLAHFPAVPMKNAGLRFTIHLHLDEADLEQLADALSVHVPAAFEEEGEDPMQAWTRFGLEPPPTAYLGPTPHRDSVAAHTRSEVASVDTPHSTARYRVERFESASELPAQAWDRFFSEQGAFNTKSLLTLERCFCTTRSDENAWRFAYYLVFDGHDRIVAATFCTLARWKDDMLSAAKTSRKIERARLRDPHFLTSRVYSMGSLITEGEHLHLDWARCGRDGALVLNLLIDAISSDAAQRDADRIVLRDFDSTERDIAALFDDAGFVELAAPESLSVDISWTDEKEFLASLPPRHRKFQRRSVQPWNDTYRVEVLEREHAPLRPSESAHLYGLYRSVVENNLAINTFPLPTDIFSHLHQAPDWEILVFHLASNDGPAPEPVAVGACFKGRDHYVPAILGMNYDYARSHGLYRQCLRHSLLRAQALGKRRVDFGFGAPLEKRRFGAVAAPRCMFVQANDHYADDAIGLMDELA